MKNLVTSKNALALFALVFVGFIPGIVQLRVGSDVSSALVIEGGQYTQFRKDFPSDYGSKILVEVPKIVTIQWWQALEDLHYGLKKLDQVYRVESLINARHTIKYVFDDGEVGMEMGDFILSDTGLDQVLWDKAAVYPPYQDVLVSQIVDGSWRVIINIIAQGPIYSDDPESLVPFDAIVFDDAVSAVLAEYEDKFIATYHVGEPRISAEISKEILRSTLFIGIVLVLMVLIVKFDTGYWRLGALSAFTGAMGLYFAWATMGYFGVDRNPINDIVVQMIIPIGAANVVHAHGYRKQYGKISYNFFLTVAIWSFGFATVTTIVGYGATGISPYPGIQQFGIFGVIGILACLLTTFCVVFPVLVELDLENKPSGVARLFRLMFGWLIKGPIILTERQTYTVLTVTAVFIGVGWFQVVVNFISANYLSLNNPVRQEFEQVRQEDSVYTLVMTFRGLTSKQLEKQYNEIHPEEEYTNFEYGSIIEPEIMIAIDAFGKKLEADPRFIGLRAIGIWEQLMQIWNEEGHGPPANRDGVVQELFTSFADFDDLELYLNSDGDTLGVLLQVPFKGSRDFGLLEQEVLAFESELAAIGAGIEVSLAGRVPIVLGAGDQIAQANIFSLMGAGGILFLLFCCLLRSFRVGALVMIANILPVFICLSLMGWLGFYLDIGSSLVITISLCLVVDDTGHFLVSYSHYRKEGKDANTAVCETLARRWEQIFVTTVVIVVGFVPMMFAPLIPFRTFATLLSLTMLFALVGDLVLLPSLLANFDRRKFSVAK